MYITGHFLSPLRKEASVWKAARLTNLRLGTQRKHRSLSACGGYADPCQQESAWREAFIYNLEIL